MDTVKDLGVQLDSKLHFTPTSTLRFLQVRKDVELNTHYNMLVFLLLTVY